MNLLDKEKQNSTPKQQSESTDAVSEYAKEKETDHVTAVTTDMLNLLDEQIADDATEKKIRKELLSLKDKMKKEGMTADVQKEYASLQHKLLEAQHEAKKHDRESEKDDDKDSDKDSDPKDSGKNSRREKIKDKARGHIQTAAIWTGGFWLLKKAFGYAKDRITSTSDATAKGGMREGWKSFFAVKTKEATANSTSDHATTDTYDAQNAQNQSAQNAENSTTADAASTHADAPETNGDHPTLDDSPEANALSQEQAGTGTQAEVDAMNDDEKAVTAEAQKEVKNSPPILTIMRLYQRGYMPKWLPLIGMEMLHKVPLAGVYFKKADELVFKQNDIRKTLTLMMSHSREWLTQQKTALIAANPSISEELANYEKQLNTIESDIKAGKVKNMKELRTTYGEIIEKRDTRRLGLRNGTKKTVIEGVEAQKKQIETHRAAIDTHSKEVEKLHADGQKKMKEYDDLIKSDPKKAATLKKEAESYITEANKKILELEKMTGADLAHLKVTNASVYDEMVKSNPLAKRLAVANDEFRAVSGLEKSGSKVVKLIAGVSLFVLTGAAAEGAITGELNRWDAVDMGAGMVPWAGDIYDMGMAIKGTDLNGREMSTADRWIRGGTGLGCFVLNCFTFGAGGTAVKAGAKATSVTAHVVKAAVKAGEKTLEKVGLEAITKGAKAVVVSEGALKTLRLATHATPFVYLGYSLAVDHVELVEQNVDRAKEQGSTIKTEAKVATTSKVEI